MKLRAVAFLLDLLLGSGRASGLSPDAATPRPNDAYFQSFASRCMRLVYPPSSPLAEVQDGD
jgi:hypothetical protein